MHLMLLGNIIDFSCIGSWPPGQDSQLVNIPRLILHFIWLTILLQQGKKPWIFLYKNKMFHVTDKTVQILDIKRCK